MQKSIYEFKDYKAYLNHVIALKPGRGRGVRSEIAQATGCQISYVSRVLNGDAHFSLEQADAINEYLGHSSEEIDFFFLLLQMNRAGRISLRNHFERQIERTLENRLLLKDRLKIKDTLSREDQATYYSAWYFAAIHILISVDAFQTKEQLSKRLCLPLSKVAEVLDFLVSVRLATATENGRYTIGQTQIHLERDSPMITKHHTNWRMYAIRSMEQSFSECLHYSVVIGISKKDSEKIRTLSVEFIEKVIELAHKSPQEDAHYMTLDFSKV